MASPENRITSFDDERGPSLFCGEDLLDRSRSLGEEIILGPSFLLDSADPEDVGNNFALEEEVSSGGQARVFKIRSRKSGKLFAVKVFREKSGALREWKVLQKHRNERTVPLCYFAGVIKSSSPELNRKCAIVMEHIEGTSLHELLKDPAFCEAMSLERALAIMAPIVRFCVNSASRRSLDVHRDINPRNIIVPGEGSARLIDFGIAGDEAHHERVVGGTEGFAAPELFFPDADEQARCDRRIDTYGIAATLYATLNGGAPPSYGEDPEFRAFSHDGDTVEELEAKVAGELRGKIRPEESAGIVAQAVRFSLDRMDAKIRLRIRECLAQDQEMRPYPKDLESIFPLNEEHYKAELLNSAVIHGLILANPAALSEEEKTLETDAPILPGYQSEVAADKSFAEALSEFNAGYYDAALPVLRKLADSGDLSAMYYLGVCIRDNLGILLPSEGDAAVAYYFSRAAEQGNILAQNAYGQMLVEGRGVCKNEDEGIRLIREAAKDDPSQGKKGFSLAKLWLETHSL